MENVLKALGTALFFFAQSVLALPDEAVNINTASVDELAIKLIGVGRSRAQAIIQYREEHGNFVDLDELMVVRGIGEHVIESNRDNIFFKE